MSTFVRINILVFVLKTLHSQYVEAFMQNSSRLFYGRKLFITLTSVDQQKANTYQSYSVVI